MGRARLIEVDLHWYIYVYMRVP